MLALYQEYDTWSIFLHGIEHSEFIFNYISIVSSLEPKINK